MAAPDAVDFSRHGHRNVLNCGCGCGAANVSANFLPHAILASGLALLDRREEAKIALDKLLEIKPDFSPDDTLAGLSPLNPEALRPQFKTWIDGLRKAGLDIPDEPSTAD